MIRKDGRIPSSKSVATLGLALLLAAGTILTVASGGTLAAGRMTVADLDAPAGSAASLPGGPVAGAKEGGVSMYGVGARGLLTKFADQIGLTDEQAERIRKISEECYTKTQELRDQLRELRFELRQLYLTSNVDQKAVEAKRSEILKVAQEIKAIVSEKRQEVLSVLTDEQKAKLETLCAGYRMGRKNRGGAVGAGIGAGLRARANSSVNGNGGRGGCGAGLGMGAGIGPNMGAGTGVCPWGYNNPS
ncbi:MAG TPA: Spy/CpxP family protein refolding chaperone [Clostridia bacterium]|nr:Spy/CpxP family protein refolding chaperone [Clostridia bacterium]